MFKKIIPLFVLSVSFTYAASGSGFFLSAGAGIGAINGDDMDTLMLYGGEPLEPSPHIAPAFNLGYEQSFTKFLSLRSGIGLLFAGAEYEAGNSGDNGPDVDIHIVNTYLTIPVEVKFLFPIKSGGIFAAFGPQPGIMLLAKWVDKEKKNQADMVDTKRFNLSIGFRAGFEIGIAKHCAYIESGYDLGLSEVYSENYNAKTSVIIPLSIGFRFN